MAVGCFSRQATRIVKLYPRSGRNDTAFGGQRILLLGRENATLEIRTIELRMGEIDPLQPGLGEIGIAEVGARASDRLGARR